MAPLWHLYGSPMVPLCPLYGSPMAPYGVILRYVINITFTYVGNDHTGVDCSWLQWISRTDEV